MMKFRIWALVILFAGTISLSGQTVQSESPSLPSLLEKNGLAKAGLRRPFRLTGGFRLNVEPPSALVGSFELVWLSPTEWRQEVRYGAYQEVRFGGDGRYWQAGKNLLSPDLIDSAIRLFRSATLVDAAGPGKPKTLDDKRLICFSTLGEDAVCLDPASGELRNQLSKNKKDETDFLYYRWFGSFAVPSVLRERNGRTRKVDAWIENVAVADGTDLSEFKPPPVAREHIYCEKPEHPQPKVTTDPEYPMNQRPRRALVRLKTVVGVDGMTYYSLVSGSGGADFDREALRALKGWKFKPATCGGTPIPMVINIEMSFWTQ